MLRPELHTPATLPAAPTQQRIAAPASMGADSSFAGVFSQARQEVVDFIEQGSGPLASQSLGVGARAHLAREYLARLQSEAPAPSGAASAQGSADARAFYASIAPWAEEAGQRLGVSGEVIAAHAALESGWGRSPLRQADGRDTHNLFGLKAGARWQGEAVQALTTEYEDGVAQHPVERFRSYADRGDAFRDFTKLLLNDPRYASALNTGADARAYAEGLVRGGYATDPAYADKLARVAARLQSRVED